MISLDHNLSRSQDQTGTSMRIRWLEKLGKPGTSFPGCGPGASKRHLDLGAEYHLTSVIKKIFYLKTGWIYNLERRRSTTHQTQTITDVQPRLCSIPNYCEAMESGAPSSEVHQEQRQPSEQDLKGSIMARPSSRSSPWVL